MNILFYAPNYLPATRYGGPIRSSHGLARALVKAGHHVTVFTTDVDGPGRLEVLLGRPVTIDGVQVRYFPIAAPRRIYRAPAMAQALRAMISEFDVVHINGCFLWPGPALATIARRAGVPVVASPRGMLQADMIAGRSTTIKRLWIAAFERRLLANAGAIHVTSEAEAEGLTALGLNLAPVSIIANGVAAPPKATGESDHWQDVPKGKRVAFLGRLDWTKGVDLALQAAASVPDAVIKFAGPDQIGLIETLTAQGHVGPNVQFLGPLDDTAKWAFLAGADVLIAPSIRESFGIAVAEALACGTPVICTPGVGASPIVATLDPGCVVARDATSLGQALGDLLADPSRLKQFRECAPALMQRDYSWPAIAARMAALYQQLAHSS